MKNLLRNMDIPQPLPGHWSQRVTRLMVAIILGAVVLGAASLKADEYSTTVLSLNPVGFWPLNETSGTTAFDISGNQNNGEYQGGVTLGAAGVSNPPFAGFASDDLAAGFSAAASDSWVTVTNLPINSASVTITEWVYPTVPGDLGTTFWNNGQNAGLARAYFNNAAMGYNWHGGDGNQWTYSAFSPPVGQWSFLALVITPTNAIFYMGNTNGLSSMINNDGNSAVNFTTGTTIGGDGGNDGSGFNGSLSDVAVFNSSLTPAQITTLFVGGYNFLPPPPAPLSLSAAAGNGEATLSWNSSAGATSYNVKRSSTSGGETTIANVIGTSYTDASLNNGTTYYYEISAANSGGESANSSEVSAIPSATITSYSAGALALGPVGFWPLNESSGSTAVDASGNGNNGTYESGVALGVAGVPNPPFAGFHGSVAASFSSTANSSWISLTNLPINTNTVTIAEWIYPTNSDAVGTTFWNAGQGGGFTGAYFNNTALGYNWPGGGGGQWTYVAFSPPVNQWSFVALVISPTNAVFYMGNANGFASMVNNNGNSAVDFTTGTTIGGDGSNDGSGFNGSLCDVAVYNYSLTPAQVAQLYTDSGGNDLPPAITEQPLSHNAYTNGSTSFGVTAIGTTPLNYQWWQGTSPVVGQTNAVLTIANVQSLAAGNYRVVITNNYGAVTSSAAILTLATAPIAYEDIVRADNPIGYWPLDLGLDTNLNTSAQYLATDFSGHGNTGTYTSISQGNQAFGPSAYIPNCVSFNGTSQFVDLSTGTNSALLQIGGIITMEAWVQGGSQVKNPADILAMGYDGSSELENEISIANGDYAGGRDSGYNVTGSAATTNWTYLVCTYDGTQWNLYVNAVPAGIKADSQGASLDTIPWAIGTGSSGGTTRFFKGGICQAALYTNALTPTQIVAHYAMGLYGTTNLTPSIATPPANQRAATNTPATFTVLATGSPLPSYQWYSIIGGVTNLIDGATSAAYTTSPVQDSDTGSGFFVVVSNSVGGIASDVAILTAGHIVRAPGILTADEYSLGYPNTLAAFGALYPTTTSLPAPNKTEYLNTFNDNVDLPNGGGERIYGWFTPPVTGNYVFFEACDDAGTLWLSTDSTPANTYEIAQNEAFMISGNDGSPDWTMTDTGAGESAYSSTGEWRSDQFESGGGQNAYANLIGTWATWPGLNTDGSIPLLAGTQYYIELDHWQNIGGQGAAVTYKLEGNADPTNGAPTLLIGDAISAMVPDSVAPEPQPRIASIGITGSKVVANGNNGLVNAAYNVLSSTNLASPLTNWTVIATQRFDSGGNFVFTNTMTTGSRQRFYFVKVLAN